MNTETNSEAPRDGRRSKLLLLAVVVVVGLIGYGAYWQLVARHYESTDDAYVAGDVVQVTREIAGTVVALNADDTQGVAAGQLLLALDPADAQVAMRRAEAELARAVRSVRSTLAQADQLQAQIAEREATLKRAQSDVQRRAGLLADGAVSGEELAHARETVTQQQAALGAAREQLKATLAQTEGTTIASHPQVLAAEAAVREAALALRRIQIKAPVAGVVARRSVQLGQRIAPGTPLMAVVPLQSVWVDANFKEVQLAQMRVGQPVELEADVYGSSAKYHGRIAGLSAGSGSAFALLPAQNASGNWIKIVQRLPVRIALDADELKAHPLRVGLSMNVTVDLHDGSGPLVAEQVRAVAQPAQASLGEDPEVEARIAKIVAEHGGTAAAHGG